MSATGLALPGTLVSLLPTAARRGTYWRSRGRALSYFSQRLRWTFHSSRSFDPAQPGLPDEPGEPDAPGHFSPPEDFDLSHNLVESGRVWPIAQSRSLLGSAFPSPSRIDVTENRGHV